MAHHQYTLDVRWTGNTGEGTASYRGYSRDNEVRAPDAGVVLGSSEPAFRGDPSRWNPEQLFLASISQCHLLWYLHLATTRGIVVVSYEDAPTATLTIAPDGSGRFTAVVLRPQVTISEGDAEVATALHDEVGRFCFIAQSVAVAVPISHEPRTTLE